MKEFGGSFTLHTTPRQMRLLNAPMDLKRNLKPPEPEPEWARGCHVGYIETVAAGELMGAHNSQPFVFNPHPCSLEQKNPLHYLGQLVLAGIGTPDLKKAT